MVELDIGQIHKQAIQTWLDAIKLLDPSDVPRQTREPTLGYVIEMCTRLDAKGDIALRRDHQP